METSKIIQKGSDGISLNFFKGNIIVAGRGFNYRAIIRGASNKGVEEY